MEKIDQAITTRKEYDDFQTRLKSFAPKELEYMNIICCHKTKECVRNERHNKTDCPGYHIYQGTSVDIRRPRSMFLEFTKTYCDTNSCRDPKNCPNWHSKAEYLFHAANYKVYKGDASLCSGGHSDPNDIKTYKHTLHCNFIHDDDIDCQFTDDDLYKFWWCKNHNPPQEIVVPVSAPVVVSKKKKIKVVKKSPVKEEKKAATPVENLSDSIETILEDSRRLSLQQKEEKPTFFNDEMGKQWMNHGPQDIHFDHDNVDEEDLSGMVRDITHEDVVQNFENNGTHSNICEICKHNQISQICFICGEFCVECLEKLKIHSSEHFHCGLVCETCTKNEVTVYCEMCNTSYCTSCHEQVHLSYFPHRQHRLFCSPLVCQSCDDEWVRVSCSSCAPDMQLTCEACSERIHQGRLQSHSRVSLRFTQ